MVMLRLGFWREIKKKREIYRPPLEKTFFGNKCFYLIELLIFYGGLCKNPKYQVLSI